MSYQQQVEQHHRESYAADVQMVAQQLRNPIRDMVTVVPASGEAQTAAELIGEADYQKAGDRDRRNPDNRNNLSRRWLVRPQAIERGTYIDKAEKFDLARDPTGEYMRNNVAAVERGWYDQVLGVEKKTDGTFGVSGHGIYGSAQEGRRPGAKSDLPDGQYLAANYRLGGASGAATGLTMDKLRRAKLVLNKAEFGLDPQFMDPMCGLIAPEQVDDLIGLAEQTKLNVNNFTVEQLVEGRPTKLLGFTWIASNRVPYDSNGNRMIAFWGKSNIVAGEWQGIEGDMWNDSSTKNLPYCYVSAYVDATRVQDKGVIIARCAEAG
ncbi:MAG: phage capsid protein [Pseudomonadota bacterium]